MFRRLEWLQNKRDNFFDEAHKNIKYIEHVKPSKYIKEIQKSYWIFLFAISALKAEISGRCLEDQYIFLKKENKSYISTSLNEIYDIVVKQPSIATIAYQRLNLTVKEQLKGALTHITNRKKAYWKEYYKVITEFCGLPLERNAIAFQPGKEGFRLLSDVPRFFERDTSLDDPIDYARISKDDRMIIRVWLPKENKLGRVSLEVQHYSRMGSLFFSPVRQMEDDDYHRTYFNDYISFSPNSNDGDVLKCLPGEGFEQMYNYSEFYSKLLMQIFLINAIDEMITVVLLKMIADYVGLDASIATDVLVKMDTELQDGAPDYTFPCDKIDSAKIWEALMTYDFHNKHMVNAHYFLSGKTHKEMLDGIYVLLMQAHPFDLQYEIGARGVAEKNNTNPFEKFIKIFSDLPAMAPTAQNKLSV
jgi:hypothetical protein